MSVLRPYIRKRIVDLSRDELVEALTNATNNCYQIEKFQESTRNQFSLLGIKQTWSSIDIFWNTKKLEYFNCNFLFGLMILIKAKNLLKLKIFILPDEGSVVLSCEFEQRNISVCGWKLKTSVAPFLSKETAIHILRLLHFDTTNLGIYRLCFKQKMFL